MVEVTWTTARTHLCVAVHTVGTCTSIRVVRLLVDEAAVLYNEPFCCCSCNRCSVWLRLSRPPCAVAGCDRQWVDRVLLCVVLPCWCRCCTFILERISGKFHHSHSAVNHVNVYSQVGQRSTYLVLVSHCRHPGMHGAGC